jgi:MFS family permease
LTASSKRARDVRISRSRRSARIPRFVLLITGIVSLAGILYGYNFSVVAGTVLFIRSDFDLGPVADELFVSVALVGAMLGAAAGRVLVDRFGRRATLMLSGLITVAGALCTALAQGEAWLFIGRFVVGAAFGAASFTGPSICPKPRRATAAGSWSRSSPWD